MADQTALYHRLCLCNHKSYHNFITKHTLYNLISFTVIHVAKPNTRICKYVGITRTHELGTETKWRKKRKIKYKKQNLHQGRSHEHIRKRSCDSLDRHPHRHPHRQRAADSAVSFQCRDTRCCRVLWRGRSTRVNSQLLSAPRSSGTPVPGVSSAPPSALRQICQSWWQRLSPR